VYYHHEISILVLCALLLYLLKLPVLPYLDITILGIGTFLAFGRIGCYSVGCCHGRPHKHGVKYGEAHVKAGFTWFYKDVPLLPVQLMESTYVFLTVIAGAILLFNQVAPGTVLIVYTVVYGLFRFSMEYFRGDPDRPTRFGISEAQWTTLLLTAITFGMGKINWLPVYSWHLVILLVMVAAIGITILYYGNHPERGLFSPQHLRELAEGLNVLEEVNSQKNNTGNINVYTTKTGLSLSCGYTQSGAKHYTLSAKNKAIINSVTASKMAQHIRLFNHHHENFELVAKQNNIYHILFPSVATNKQQHK
jgi:hypothetical protein